MEEFTISSSSTLTTTVFALVTADAQRPAIAGEVRTARLPDDSRQTTSIHRHIRLDKLFLFAKHNPPGRILSPDAGFQTGRQLEATRLGKLVFV